MHETPDPTFLSRRRFLKGLLLAPLALAAQPLLAARKPREISLAFLASSVPLTRRSAWACRSPNPAKLRSAAFFSRLTVHHSGTDIIRHTDRRQVVADLNGVLEAHTRIRYGDIGYHFIIDYAGRLWEGRSLSYEGAHVSSENQGNIGLMVLGNFERQAPSKAQLDTLSLVTGLLRRHFAIPARRLYGHRDIGASVCPGRHLYPHVVNLRSAKPQTA